MQFRTRQQNNLRPPRARSTFTKANGAYVHWTAGPPTQTVRQIQDYHMDNRGYHDIGYSWLADVHGTIHQGRGWGVSGAHTVGYNSSSHAVSAILGPGHSPSQEQLNAIARVLAEHARRYGAGYVRCHRDVFATSCPGDELCRWVKNKGWQRQDVSDNRQFWETLAQAIEATERKSGWTNIRQRKHYAAHLGIAAHLAPRKWGLLTPGYIKRITQFQAFMGIKVRPWLTWETKVWLNYLALAD